VVEQLLERSGILVSDNLGPKVVLLAGASGTVGTAFCERFAPDYHIVAVRHRRPLKVASQLQAFFDPFAETPAASADEATVFEVRGDLRERRDVDRIVEVALARFGHIDAVVNAVGARPRGRDMLGAALREAPEEFRLHALVPLEVATAVALQYWRHHDLENAERNRVVVNMSAAASVDATERSLPPAVGASKAAMNLLSMHLAEALRPFNVRVVTIAPAAIPNVVSLERVTEAVHAVIEGDQNERLLLMWDEGDELV
jgi:3-oxoacyl-[acyl-carrier protein] reductase